jgi:hypothetical protein
MSLTDIIIFLIGKFATVSNKITDMIDNIRKTAVNNNNISDYYNKISSSYLNNSNTTTNTTTTTNNNNNGIIEYLTINDVKSSVYFKDNQDIDLNCILIEDILQVNDKFSLDVFVKVCNKINENINEHNNNNNNNNNENKINIGIDCEWKPNINSNDNYNNYV